MNLGVYLIADDVCHVLTDSSTRRVLSVAAAATVEDLLPFVLFLFFSLLAAAIFYLFLCYAY